MFTGWASLAMKACDRRYYQSTTVGLADHLLSVPSIANVPVFIIKFDLFLVKGLNTGFSNIHLSIRLLFYVMCSLTNWLSCSLGLHCACYVHLILTHLYAWNKRPSCLFIYFCCKWPSLSQNWNNEQHSFCQVFICAVKHHSRTTLMSTPDTIHAWNLL